MMKHGQKVMDLMDEIKSSGTSINISKDAESTVFKVSGAECKLEVIVNPGKWLGLTFHVTGTKIAHEINTDLYNISLPKYAQFADEIEADIIAFLNSLKSKKVLISSDKRRVLIPLGRENILISAGRWLAKSKSYNDLAEAKAKLGSDYKSMSL